VRERQERPTTTTREREDLQTMQVREREERPMTTTTEIEDLRTTRVRERQERPTTTTRERGFANNASDRKTREANDNNER